MRHHIIVKFLAIFLCAASLLGALGGGLGMFVVSEVGLNSRTPQEAYEESVTSTAEALAHELAVRYAAKHLGNADDHLIQDYYGYHWLYSTFNWDKIGYTISGEDGTVLDKQEYTAGTGPEGTFSFDVQGSQYLHVNQVLTEEEYHALHAPETTYPISSGDTPEEMLVCNNVPQGEGSRIYSVRAVYSDGHVVEYDPGDGYLGQLSYFAPQQLIFRVQSDYTETTALLDDMLGSVATGMTFRAEDGSTVFEVVCPYGVFTVLCRQPGNSYFVLHPMDNALPLEPGSIFDAIPDGGAAVCTCSMVFAGGHEETVGSDQLIGNIDHDEGGLVIFTAASPEVMPYYPEPLTYVAFRDLQGNLLYEARDIAGVGHFQMGEELIFVSLEPSASPEVPEDAAPPEATEVPDATEVPEDQPEIYVYDDVPPGGYEVYRMEYWLEGSDRGSVLELTDNYLGHVLHEEDGSIRFTARDWKHFVFSKPARVICIRMEDMDGRLLYEARQADVPSGTGCPIGTFAYDEEGALAFRMLDASETSAPGTRAAAASSIHAWVVQENTNLRAAPHADATALDILPAGTWTEILEVVQVGSEEWGQTGNGWILLSAEAPETEAAAASLEESQPESAAAAEETQPDPSVSPEETMVGSTEPTLAATEPVQALPPQDADNSLEGKEFYGYYDSKIGQLVFAEYTFEPMPAYTVEVTFGPNALSYNYEWQLIGMLYNIKDHLIFVLAGSLLLFAITAVYLCCSAARKPGSQEVRPGGLNRMPLDLYLAAAAGGTVLCAFGIVEGCDYLLSNDLQTGILFTVLLAFLAALLVVSFCFAFAAQIKTPGGYLWRNSLCGYAVKLIAWLWRRFLGFCSWLLKFLDEKLEPLVVRSCKALWKLTKFFLLQLKRFLLWAFGLAKRITTCVFALIRRGCSWFGRIFLRFFSLLPLTWQWLLTGFVLVLLLYIMMRTYKVGYILVGFGSFFGVLLYASSAFGTLLESAKQMRKGDLDQKVDDRLLIGSFRDFADELNGLADVAVIAAQKQLKSERMKTELITNVSHDIKTPLTSIINYVDLMEKPHSPQEQQEYLEVLSRQSLRLKKLVDDLMEMSKASTGNMTVDITRVNAAEAINQALGEFADKLDAKELIPVFRQPETDITMMADGKLVWRVLSNLLSNTVKYALPGTRVYIDLMELEGKVVLSLKNISREPLNVSADELLERFVRGDTARNTEGSGLGLNIAKSLMELQKGRLELLVDGDLFKVTLIFPSA